MRNLMACATACALIAGCAAPSTELTFGDDLEIDVHHGESGVSLVEVKIGASEACRSAKLAIALRGVVPKAVVARRAEEVCARV